jgi:hypothetical protein
MGVRVFRVGAWDFLVGVTGADQGAIRRARGILQRLRGGHLLGQEVTGEVRVIYAGFETQGEALAAFHEDLEQADPQWRDVLAIREEPQPADAA